MGFHDFQMALGKIDGFLIKAHDNHGLSLRFRSELMNDHQFRRVKLIQIDILGKLMVLSNPSTALRPRTVLAKH